LSLNKKFHIDCYIVNKKLNMALILKQTYSIWKNLCLIW